MAAQGYGSDLSGIDIALYTGGTTSASSRDALFEMFLWMNASVVILSAASIRAGVLRDYDLLVVPGGDASEYNDALGYSGLTEIRSFIEGGAFFGVCAGAYFACDQILWEDSLIEYSLDLFDGRGTGAIDAIAEWPNYDMCVIDINRSSTAIDLSDEPDNHTVMYFGGPYFTMNDSSGIEVLARYRVNDNPAMIAFEYEAGRVFLSGPHPEWEEDSDRDGQAWPDGFDDLGSEWDMMLTISLWLTEIPSQTSSTTPTASALPTSEMLGIVLIGVGAFGVIVTLAYIIKNRKY